MEVPAGVVWSDVTAFLMKKYNVEIAGGLGPSVGKVFRIGLMGHNARPGNVELVLAGARLRLRSARFRAACAAARGFAPSADLRLAALRDALQHAGYSIPHVHTEL